MLRVYFILTMRNIIVLIQLLLPLLTVSINNNYRNEYELDEREESNNVKYNGQAEEKQQDKNSEINTVK